jgi:hypothetical protein
MLNELQQKRVWEGWLSAEIRANYFADLSRRYHYRQRLATWSTLFLSSGAAVAFVAGLPREYAWVAPILSLLTAAVSAYSLVMQNQKSAMDSADLYFRWNKLAGEYERLWESMYSEDALAQLSALEERAAELSKVATAFPVKRKQLLKWQQHVEMHHGVSAHART